MHIKETGNSVRQKVDVLPFRRQRKETTADTIGNNKHSQYHTEMDDFISYTPKKSRHPKIPAFFHLSSKNYLIFL